MINAINLHSSAMESRNVSNQLLNLWTIVEVLIEIDKHYSYSKIVQISNTLTTVLNSSYIKSLIEQLIFDLEHCCVEFDNRLENITKGNTKVEKMVAMLVLPEFDQNKTDLVNALMGQKNSNQKAFIWVRQNKGNDSRCIYFEGKNPSVLTGEILAITANAIFEMPRKDGIYTMASYLEKYQVLDELKKIDKFKSEGKI